MASEYGNGEDYVRTTPEILKGMLERSEAKYIGGFPHFDTETNKEDGTRLYWPIVLVDSNEWEKQWPTT